MEGKKFSTRESVSGLRALEILDLTWVSDYYQYVIAYKCFTSCNPGMQRKREIWERIEREIETIMEHTDREKERYIGTHRNRDGEK